MARISLLLILMWAFAVANTGCVSLQRSSASGYRYREAEQNFGRDRRVREFEESAQELGFRDGEHDSEVVEARIMLRKAEAMIEGKREREQYFKNKPYMRSDRERVEFLSLESYEDRQRWL